MSTFRIGSEKTKDRDLPAPVSNMNTYIDKVTKWIPGDVLAIYTAGVTVLKQSQGSQPSILWLVIMAFVTPILVFLFAFSVNEKINKKLIFKAVLAFFGFAIWSLTIPFSGWQTWDLIYNHPGFITVIAGLAGLLFGLLAEGVLARTNNK
jgi:hypothetical protein